VLASEQPDQLPGFTGVVSKETLERFHLERLRADLLLRTGVVPFEAVERGADPSKPPDFLVETPAGLTRLDLAALARADRRNGYRLFAHLQRRLERSAGIRDFSGVAGCAVLVWFGATLSDLPPKRSDDDIVDELLDLIASAQVDHDAHGRMMAEVAIRGFPPHFPPIVASGSTTNREAGFSTNVILPPERATEIPGGLGFQLQFHMPLTIMKSEVLAEFQRVTKSHDQPEIDHLVITPGAPDRSGLRYPAEEAIAALLFEEEPPRVIATYLRRVTAHLWSRCEAIEIAVEKAAE
jgi:hypothetical protein